MGQKLEEGQQLRRANQGHEEHDREEAQTNLRSLRVKRATRLLLRSAGRPGLQHIWNIGRQRSFGCGSAWEAAAGRDGPRSVRSDGRLAGGSVEMRLSASAQPVN